MNNSFRFNRFCNLIKLQLTFEWRTLLIGMGGLTLGIVILYLMATINNPVNTITNSSIAAARFFTLLSSMFLYSYLISVSFKPYLKRGVGSASMMLPATRLEKFLVISLKLVIAPIAIASIILLVDAMWVEGVRCFMDQPGTTKNLSHISTDSPNIVGIPWQMDGLLAAIITTLILEIAIYFLCSVIFRRHTQLFSFIALSLFNFNLIGGSMILKIHLLSDVSIGFGSSEYLEVFSACNIVLIAVAIYLTWVRFTRIQISK